MGLCQVFGLNKYLPITAAMVAVSLLGRIGWLEMKAAKLTAENASYQRSIADLTMQRDQSKEARVIEAARVVLWKKQAAKLNASIEALLTGDIPDENLDIRITDFINGLYGAD